MGLILISRFDGVKGSKLGLKNSNLIKSLNNNKLKFTKKGVMSLSTKLFKQINILPVVLVTRNNKIIDRLYVPKEIRTFKLSMLKER